MCHSAEFLWSIDAPKLGIAVLSRDGLLQCKVVNAVFVRVQAPPLLLTASVWLTASQVVLPHSTIILAVVRTHAGKPHDYCRSPRPQPLKRWTLRRGRPIVILCGGSPAISSDGRDADCVRPGLTRGASSGHRQPSLSHEFHHRTGGHILSI